MVLMVTRKKAEMATTATLGPSPKGSGKISIMMGKMAILGNT